MFSKVHLEPKAANKKVEELKRHDKSPEPNGSVEEYPAAQIRVVMAEATHRVTKV